MSFASSFFRPLPDAIGASSTFFLGRGLPQNSFRLDCCGGAGLVPLGISKNLPGEESTIETRAYMGRSATKGKLASHARTSTRQDTKHHTVIELGHAVFDQITDGPKKFWSRTIVHVGCFREIPSVVQFVCGLTLTYQFSSPPLRHPSLISSRQTPCLSRQVMVRIARE